MFASTLALGLMAAFTTASPVAPRQITPHYPETITSKGFHLVVNVTDPSTDFDPPINKQYINSIHIGPPNNLLGITPEPGRIFYQNGTAYEIRFGQSTVISDGATPPLPFGLSLVPDADNADISTARLDAGPGTQGLAIARFPDPYAYLIWETFMACNEFVPYYQRDMVIIKRKGWESEVPDNCVAVRLLPECTELNELPEDAWSSHEFAADSKCYEDVSSIVWSEYGP